MVLKREEFLYKKARDYISERIAKGELKPGDKLPSEFDLSSEFQISRSTLRDALKMLEESGMIVKKHGLGTFVSSSQDILKYSMERFHSITEIIKSMDMEPATKDKKVYLCNSDDNISEKLKIKKNSEVIVLERVRTADKNPIVYSLEYLPKNIIDCDLEQLDSYESLSEFLKNNCSQKISRTITKFYPYPGDEVISKKLNIAKNSLVLKMEHVDLSETDIPVVFAIEYFNSHAFEFTIIRKWKI